MVSPYADSHAHEHEWAVPEHSDAWLYEDGAMHVWEDCRYIEQRSAGHSERLDETFYETMYECDASRSHRFDLTGIERVTGPLDEGSDLRGDDTDAAQTLSEGADVFEIAEDVGDVLLEEIELAAAQRLSEGLEDDPHPVVVDWFSYDGVEHGPHYVEVHVECDLLEPDDCGWYRLRYEHTDTERM